MEPDPIEEDLLRLRSTATHLLLRDDLPQYISLYTTFITHHLSSPTPHKSLATAFSHRADALHRSGNLQSALLDCHYALDLNPSHPKTLLLKAQILLDLRRYSSAARCLERLGTSERVRGLLERCRRMEEQGRSGRVDLSGWVLEGGELPEMGEFVGPVEVGIGSDGERGLFATKNVDAGSTLFFTKAVAVGRGILPEEAGDEERLAMWKEFVERVIEKVGKCRRTLELIYCLSNGEKDEDVVVPEMGVFSPERGEEENGGLTDLELNVERILKVLDVNCLTGDGFSGSALGRSSGDGGCCNVGLWVLAGFLNHSCSPNARRLHVGEHVVVVASRDVKASEELTFAYFDVFNPVGKRKELARGWGFQCQCERCVFDEKISSNYKQCGTTFSNNEFGVLLRELEGLSDPGELVVRLEEGMKKNKRLKEKERGCVRASFWKAYSDVYGSERLMRKWGRRIPTEMVVAESIFSAVGGEERVLKVLANWLKKKKKKVGCGEEMVERVVKLGRSVYGKVIKKKQAMVRLMEEL